MTEIENPNFLLPKNIFEKQLQKFFKLENFYFATAIKQVFWQNLELPKNFKKPHFSGILFAKKGEKKWRKFLEITDRREIFHFIFGTKTKNFGKNWQPEKCFWAVGFDLQKISQNPKLKINFLDDGDENFGYFSEKYFFKKVKKFRAAKKIKKLFLKIEKKFKN